MPSISLQDIRDAADKKYEPLVIELEDGPATLVNVLRLPKAARAKLSKLDDDVKDGDEKADELESRLSAIVKVAATPGDAKRILAAVGDDAGLLALIVEMWAKATQVGEASPSAS